MRRLVLFAKEPVPGRVKTRLARDVGDAAAVGLYRAFLRDLAAALPCGGDWDCVLAHDGEAGTFLRKTFGPPWRLEPQGGGSLGDRLARCFARAAAGGSTAVVAGSDAPTLSRQAVREAFAHLETGAPVVVAPSPDGGFSLVGLQVTVDAGKLFSGVGWSTPDALADTRQAANRLGLEVVCLPAIPDVDVAADLLWLQRELRTRPDLAPETRRVLTEVA